MKYKEDFVQLVGDKEGPVSVIIAGVHGDEKCGVIALGKLLPGLRIERGRVWFGYGNIGAIKANKRFVSCNLNRMFKNSNLFSGEEKKSYEYKRAQFIKKYLDCADALLDVHASFTPNSKPFVICEKNAKEIVKYLPVSLVVSGFDKVEPGSTDGYMNDIGKIGICMECGYLGDVKAVKMARRGILSFLQARGHLKKKVKPRKQTHVCVYYLYKTKTNKFTLAKAFKDFEKIAKGQIIGIDGNKEVRAKKSSIILFARNRKLANDEAFLLGEEKDSFK